MKRYLDSCRAEWLKLFSTRSWWILGLVMVLYVAFTAALVGLLVGVLAQDLFAIQTDLHLAGMIYGLGPSIGYIFPVLVGALCITAEYRHRTIAPSFLWSGSRSAVLGGKLTVQFILGVAFGIASLLAAVIASVFFLLANGISTDLTDPNTWLMFLRSSIAMGLWAVIGVGVGALLRNQAATIVIVLVFTQFVEPMARMLGAFNQTAGAIVSYLPGAASDSFTGASFFSMMSSGTSYDSLSWWAGALVLSAYAFISVLAAWLTRWRGDVN